VRDEEKRESERKIENKFNMIACLKHEGQMKVQFQLSMIERDVQELLL